MCFIYIYWLLQLSISFYEIRKTRHTKKLLTHEHCFHTLLQCATHVISVNNFHHIIVRVCLFNFVFVVCQEGQIIRRGANLLLICKSLYGVGECLVMFRFLCCSQCICWQLGNVHNIHAIEFILIVQIFGKKVRLNSWWFSYFCLMCTVGFIVGFFLRFTNNLNFKVAKFIS